MFLLRMALIVASMTASNLALAALIVVNTAADELSGDGGKDQLTDVNCTGSDTPCSGFWSSTGRWISSRSSDEHPDCKIAEPQIRLESAWSFPDQYNELLGQRNALNQLGTQFLLPKRQLESSKISSWSLM